VLGAGAPNSEPGAAVWAPPGMKPADCGAAPEPADVVAEVVAVEKLNNPPDGAVPNNGAMHIDICVKN